MINRAVQSVCPFARTFSLSGAVDSSTAVDDLGSATSDSDEDPDEEPTLRADADGDAATLSTPVPGFSVSASDTVCLREILIASIEQYAPCYLVYTYLFTARF